MYPHIIDRIFQLAPPASLYALGTGSKAWRKRALRLLSNHIAISFHSTEPHIEIFATTIERPPPTVGFPPPITQSGSALQLPHVRVIDFVGYLNASSPLTWPWWLPELKNVEVIRNTTQGSPLATMIPLPQCDAYVTRTQLPFFNDPGRVVRPGGRIVVVLGKFFDLMAFEPNFGLTALADWMERHRARKIEVILYCQPLPQNYIMGVPTLERVMAALSKAVLKLYLLDRFGEAVGARLCLVGLEVWDQNIEGGSAEAVVLNGVKRAIAARSLEVSAVATVFLNAAEDSEGMLQSFVNVESRAAFRERVGEEEYELIVNM